MPLDEGARALVFALVWLVSSFAHPPVAEEPVVHTTIGPLPAAVERHLSTALKPALPPDTVEYVYVSLSRVPTGNYRVRFGPDGALSVDRHRGGDWQKPFDGGWPARPQGRLSVEQRKALGAALAALADHPGYEAITETRGGGAHVLRWRSGGVRHQVVFQNAPHPIFDRIYLWAAPHL